MATVNLGRVGFVPKGEYVPSTEYVKFDTVTYGSNTYVAWATVTGVTPGTDEQKWKLLVNNNVDIEELRSRIDNIPDVAETDETEANLDLADESGYVIARFIDGDIKTKNFDSSVAVTNEELQQVSNSIADVQSMASETKYAFDMIVGDYEIDVSPNLYDKSKQTSETISPHYYVNGVPYSSTQFDSSYNCTALIEVEPNTTYTVGLVGNASGRVNPWNTATQRGWSYDADGVYISDSNWNSNTFTTPSNAKYIRFNYYIADMSLDMLNSQCMLVKGETLPEEYRAYGTTVTSDLQKEIEANSIGFEWKFSGGDLLIGVGYNDTDDAVIVINQGRANNLLDFAALMTKPRGESLIGLETANLQAIWTSSTDMHSPFQFNAINNADGYYASATTPGFVGGNHTLDQMGSDFKTATSKYVRYYADGKPVSSGYGKATHFEIRWANDVQAYNTVKQGGGGRACLTEYHDMIFDGIRFNETVKLVASEDIDMRLWYGFQFVSWGNVYDNMRFIGGANRGLYTSGNVNSGAKMTSGMEAHGDDDDIELTVDANFDLGKRDYVSNNYTDGAFTSGTKGYFRIITTTGFTMQANDAYYLKGTFRFCPYAEGGDE